MKRIVTMVVVVLGLVLAAQLSAVARTADSILLSKLIWGMPSDRLVAALKLNPDQYTVLHNPTDFRITIYQTDGKLFNFPEFRTVYLNFNPENGLFKINGFYHGALADIVTALKKRYGEPDLVKTSSLSTQYRWDFDAAALSITDAQFEISPK